jgi:polyisoprenyl-phosphate glycosyltransferase
MSSGPVISIVSPVYGRKLDLNSLYERIKHSVEPLDPGFELILVNDASPDDAWEKISSLATRDERVRGINLSRNFGQHFAITAGLDYARGEWIVVMDCDLQDLPEEIPKMYQVAKDSDYDVVAGRRVDRKDSVGKSLTSKLFYVLFNYLTDQKLNNEVASFGVYSRRLIQAVKSFKEKDRAFGLLVVLAGFKRIEVPIEHGEREAGESAYNFSKRLNMALDLTLSHSTKPLKLCVKSGLIMSFVAFLAGCFVVVRNLIGDIQVSGWTSLIVSLYFLFGMLMAVIGVVGLYVGKIYQQVKDRPLYFVEQTTFKGQA